MDSHVHRSKEINKLLLTFTARSELLYLKEGDPERNK